MAGYGARGITYLLVDVQLAENLRRIQKVLVLVNPKPQKPSG